MGGTKPQTLHIAIHANSKVWLQDEMMGLMTMTGTYRLQTDHRHKHVHFSDYDLWTKKFLSFRKWLENNFLSPVFLNLAAKRFSLPNCNCQSVVAYSSIVLFNEYCFTDKFTLASSKWPAVCAKANSRFMVVTRSDHPQNLASSCTWKTGWENTFFGTWVHDS